MLEGKEKCVWRAGQEIVKKYGLNGDCPHCRFKGYAGVHMICYVGAESGRATPKDCESSQLKGTAPDFTAESRRCYLCDTHYKPKTKRCSECVQTENLDNFKKSEEFDEILKWWGV